MKHLIRIIMFSLFILLVACSQVEPVAEESLDPSAANKKLIQVDWNPVTPSFFADNLVTMETKPFQGIIVSLSVSGDIFKKTAYPTSAYSSDRADLATVKANATKLRSNFLRIDTRQEETWSWLNQSDWNAAKTNVQNFALSAKAGGFKGFWFDAEAYGFSPWVYTPARYQGKSFTEVSRVVRNRGKEFMNTVQAQLPNAVMMFPWFLSAARYGIENYGETRQTSTYALFIPFVEGMIEVANSGVTFVDGNEFSYDYAFAKEYDDSIRYSKTSKSLLLDSLEAKYASQSRMAQSIYVDGLMNIYTSPRFFGFYFASDSERRKKYEHAVYHSLRSSDEYVWVYSEQPEWWTNTLTSGLETAQRSALIKLRNGQSLGFEENFISAAKTAFDKRIVIFGSVTDASGRGLTGAVLNSGFTFQGKESSCVVYNTDGDYTCTVPFGWSGTVTPKLAGKIFTPARRTYTNVGSNPDDLNGIGYDNYVGQ
jgi:hypothetical protein